MATISISLDNNQKQLIDRISQEDGVSRSEVIQNLLKQASWERTWVDMARQLRAKLDQLNLETVDDIESFLG